MHDYKAQISRQNLLLALGIALISSSLLHFPDADSSAEHRVLVDAPLAGVADFCLGTLSLAEFTHAARYMGITIYRMGSGKSNISSASCCTIQTMSPSGSLSCQRLSL